MARECGGRDPTLRPWSDEETAALKELWSQHDNEFIAARLGRSEQAITARANRIGLPPRTPDSTTTLRWCLGRCGQQFLSEGPHNRICRRCKASDEWADGAELAGLPLQFYSSDP